MLEVLLIEHMHNSPTHNSHTPQFFVTNIQPHNSPGILHPHNSPTHNNLTPFIEPHNFPTTTINPTMWRIMGRVIGVGWGIVRWRIVGLWWWIWGWIIVDEELWENCDWRIVGVENSTILRSSHNNPTSTILRNYSQQSHNSSSHNSSPHNSWFHNSSPHNSSPHNSSPQFFILHPANLVHHLHNSSQSHNCSSKICWELWDCGEELWRICGWRRIVGWKIVHPTILHSSSHNHSFF